MPSLSEMRARKGSVARPRSTHTVTLVTGQHLLDEQKRLNDELADELVKAARAQSSSDEEGDEKPRKMSERTTPERVNQIREEIAGLYDKLGEHQGQLTLVGALSDGQWLSWKQEHPPREDNTDDERVGHGFVNTTDLFNALGSFVAEWDGEALSDGDWDGWLAEQITFADKAALVGEVVALYETRLSRAPKSPGSSSETAPGSND